MKRKILFITLIIISISSTTFTILKPFYNSKIIDNIQTDTFYKWRNGANPIHPRVSWPNREIICNSKFPLWTNIFLYGERPRVGRISKRQEPH